MNSVAYAIASQLSSKLDNTFSQKAPIASSQRRQFNIVTVGNDFYIIGGQQPGCMAYNAVTNTWTTKNSPARWTAESSAGTNGSYIYLYAGYNNTNGGYNTLIYYYNISTNTWTQSPNQTLGLAYAFSVNTFVNGVYRIFSFGGLTSSVVSTSYELIMSGAYLTSPYTSSITSMPTARYWAGGGAVGNNIYVIGGGLSSGVTGVNEMYDSLTNTWTTKTSKLTAGYGFASCVVGSKIYMFGGSNSNNKLEIYDSTSNTWSSITLTGYTFSESRATYCNNLIFVLGGYINGSESAMNLTYVEKDPTLSLLLSILAIS